MANRNMFMGLDAHEETIDIAVADGGRQGEVRHYGTIAGELEALDKVVRAMRAPNRALHFVYEAGPCGFGIHRHLTTHQQECVVVSPSMISKRSGDRVKIDRRDRRWHSPAAAYDRCGGRRVQCPVRCQAFSHRRCETDIHTMLYELNWRVLRGNRTYFVPKFLGSTVNKDAAWFLSQFPP